MILPIILSGGTGSRLWPVSREQYPKQFLPLHDDKLSLFQEAALRLDDQTVQHGGLGDPIVVCNADHRFLVAEQLQSIGKQSTRILLEPCGRNTAPALALAALTAEAHSPDSILLVMPADHVVEQPDVFAEAVRKGVTLVEGGHLVTFGITPNRPHTGYGYIRRGEAVAEGYRVDSFVEKPDEARARSYLESGDYFWNSGIFLFRAADYLDELAVHASDILQACRQAYAGSHEDLDFLRIDESAFLACRSESIDYAVMEHTQRATVVPMDPGWSDIGAWDAIHTLKQASNEQNGNATQGDVLLYGARNSYVRSESRLVAAVGVEDLVIVETDDAVLVANRHCAQDTKHIVTMLKTLERSESRSHQRIYRPWGHYRAMVLTDSFQVKEIVVKPGAKLSLQMHFHRAEHWVIVEGTARVTQGQGHGDIDNLKSFLLSEDESTYIPLGTVHRLENPGTIPLKLIEVQTGSYLGEDDIVRFDDVYGRSAQQDS